MKGITYAKAHKLAVGNIRTLEVHDKTLAKLQKKVAEATHEHREYYAKTFVWPMIERAIEVYAALGFNSCQYNTIDEQAKLCTKEIYKLVVDAGFTCYMNDRRVADSTTASYLNVRIDWH
jgi:hypothetical protein